MQYLYWLEIIVFFIILITLGHLKILRWKDLTPGMAIATGVIILSLWMGEATLKDVGLRTDNLADVWLPYTSAFIVGLAVVGGFARSWGKTIQPKWWTNKQLQYGFIITSALQEFLFRGFIVYATFLVTDSILWIVVINTILFMYAHSMFVPLKGALIYSSIAGIVATTLYVYYPNLIAIIILHALLSFWAELHNMFRTDVI